MHKDILGTISIVGIGVGFLLFVLSWPIAEGITKIQTWYEKRKKERKESH